MAIRLREGRWALSRIVTEPSAFPGGDAVFTTAAMRDRLAQNIEAYYPPLNDARTAYAIGFAMVRLEGNVQAPANADTRLIPSALLDATLRDLTQQQRQRLRAELEEWFTGYQFTDYDGSIKVKQAFSAAGYTLNTPIRAILLDLFGHLAHSESRPRIIAPESHNTEYLDDFATDPFSAPRWTNRLQTTTWDSTNLELDVGHVGQPTLVEYTANTPGSIEHEAQATFQTVSSETRGLGAAVRIDGGSANDFYAIGTDLSDEIRIWRRQGGSVTQLAASAFSITPPEFITARLAASGAAGANVALSGWRTAHGMTKPSDPGWYGADGSPDITYTDTAANRLDDSTHDACGIGGAAALSSDFDTRIDFWKSRAISDRSGGGSTVAPGVGSIVLAGIAPSLAQTAHHFVSLGLGGVTVAGLAPSVSFTENHFASPGVGAIVVSGEIPSVVLTTDNYVFPAVGSIVLAGLAPTLAQTQNHFIGPDVGSILLQGLAPTVTVTASGVVAPDVGAITIQGLTPTVVTSADGTVQPGTGAILIEGLVPTMQVTDHMTVLPSVGAIDIGGLVPSVVVTQNHFADPAVVGMLLEGLAPTIIATTDHYRPIGVGALVFAGLAPTLAQTGLEASSGQTVTLMGPQEITVDGPASVTMHGPVTVTLNG